MRGPTASCAECNAPLKVPINEAELLEPPPACRHPRRQCTVQLSFPIPTCTQHAHKPRRNPRRCTNVRIKTPARELEIRMPSPRPRLEGKSSTPELKPKHPLHMAATPSAFRRGDEVRANPWGSVFMRTWYYLEAQRDSVRDFLQCRTIGVPIAHSRLLGFHVVRSTRPFAP